MVPYHIFGVSEDTIIIIIIERYDEKNLAKQNYISIIGKFVFMLLIDSSLNSNLCMNIYTINMYDPIR